MKNTIIRIGDLVIFNGPTLKEALCVILTDGVSGYGDHKRVVYVIYCPRDMSTRLAYDYEVSKLQFPGKD